MTVQLSNCADPENSPSSMVTSLTATPLKLSGTSADGIDLSGTCSENLEQGTWTWSSAGAVSRGGPR